MIKIYLFLQSPKAPPRPPPESPRPPPGCPGTPLVTPEAPQGPPSDPQGPLRHLPDAPRDPSRPPRGPPRPSPEITRAVLAAFVEHRSMNSPAASSHQPSASSQKPTTSSHYPATRSQQWTANLGGCSCNLRYTPSREQPSRSLWGSLSTQPGPAECAERLNPPHPLRMHSVFK